MTATLVGLARLHAWGMANSYRGTARRWHAARMSTRRRYNGMTLRCARLAAFVVQAPTRNADSRCVPSVKCAFERARYDPGCRWKRVAGAPENCAQVRSSATQRRVEINRAVANLSRLQVSGTSRPRVVLAPLSAESPSRLPREVRQVRQCFAASFSDIFVFRRRKFAARSSAPPVPQGLQSERGVRRRQAIDAQGGRVRKVRRWMEMKGASAERGRIWPIDSRG